MFAKTMLILFLAVHECKCFILKRHRDLSCER
jgi:hypothetical protein